MSHYSVLVIMPEGAKLEDRSDIERRTEAMLAPYDENAKEMFADGTRWDWWVIGGRFSGELDGYDPDKNEDNWEVCKWCHGTGTRDVPVPVDAAPLIRKLTWKPEEPWAPEKGRCNVCGGTAGGHPGKARKWFNEPYSGDVNTVRTALANGAFVCAVLTPDDGWIERGRMGWFGASIKDEEGKEEKAHDEWRAQMKGIMERYIDRVCVLVDCHI